MKDKIYVDALPCKISWTTPLLLICIVATIAAIAVTKIAKNSVMGPDASGTFADVALYGGIFSGLLWITFFALFAYACKNLPNSISTATMFMAITSSVAFITGNLYSIYKSTGFMITDIVFSILCICGLFWLGEALRKNYSSTLGDIGYALNKIVKIAIAVVLVTCLYVALGLFSSYIAIALLVCAIVLGIWMLWIMLDDVIVPMYQMLNWGHQEGVTQNDIRDCIAATKSK